MALKNLVINVKQLTEEAIEAGVKEYVCYNVDESRVHLTAKGRKLDNERKVLARLLAQRGWLYILDSEERCPAVFMSPKELEQELAIKGGTLRPLLRKLYEKGWLEVKKGRYGIHLASVSEIVSLLKGE